MKKLTKREVLGMLAEVEGVKANPIFMEYISHEVTLLDRKKTSGKMTANQEQNVLIKELIVETLRAVGEPITITEMQSKNDELAQYTNQKLSALLSQLNVKNGGNVDKVTEKKITRFFLVD